MFSKNVILFLSKEPTYTCLLNWNLYSAYASLEIRAIFQLLTHKFMKNIAWLQAIL